MLPSFMQEEMARQRNDALIIAAQRAAESARYRRANGRIGRLRKAFGLRLVRLGTRLAETNSEAGFGEAAHDCC
jgi:hypothetical protein